MILEIKDILDIHKNKTSYVVANGPSTLPNLKRIVNAAKNKEENVIFVCNEIDEMLQTINLDLIKHVNPDFWVIANTILTVQSRHKSFNLLKQNNGKLLYANSVDMTQNPEQYLEIDFLPYDQRHFDHKPCPIYDQHFKCCTNVAHLMPHRLTVQEELQKYCSYHTHYGTASTVALHMLAFSILMGCKKIYLSGIDLNYKLGYFDRKTYNPDSFIPWLDQILDDFKIINESSKQIGVEIINLSSISPLKDIFITESP